MNKQFSRTIGLLGEKDFNKIVEKKIIVFGCGGVGAATIESLARFGLKSITFVDYDRVDESNLNRQVFTSRRNIGSYKCLALRDRIREINPEIKVEYKIKKILNNPEDFKLEDYDYVVDAIDTVTGKLSLIENCKKNSIKLISSMGAGNRLDPSKIKVMDIYDTKNDALARVMRRELRKRSIDSLKVVCSDEQAISKSIRNQTSNKSTPLSSSFVPAVAGYILAAEIIKDILRS